ncbi:MAG: hypothetical protein ACLQFI_05645, partial [Methylocella sp.]
MGKLSTSCSAPKRDVAAAKAFFRRAFKSWHIAVPCDARQLVVEHPGKCQQIVALFLQCRTPRTNARRVQV